MKQPRFRPMLAHGCIVALATASSPAAHAQDRVPTATGSSERAGFEAQGLPAGGFRLYPTMRVTTTYDDNVFLRNDDAKIDDAFVTLAPAIDAKSGWSRHALNARAFLSSKHYFSQTQNDNDEYGVSADGRLDVLRTFVLSGTAGYSHLVETPGTSGDVVSTGRYVPYTVGTASLEATKQFNRIRLTVNGNFGSFRYNDVVTASSPIDQSFRDRNRSSVGARAEYQYSGTTSLFVSGSVNRIRYQNVRTDGIDRRSDGASGLVGIRFELSRLLSGEVGVGYISQSFDDPRFSSFGGLNYNASLRYQPTQLTSVTVRASRNLTDSGLTEVGGVLSSQFVLGVEHELLRYVLVSANASYINDAYRGIDRNDDRFGFGVGGRYRFNRYLSAALSLDRVSQTTDAISGRSYAGNRVSLSLIGAR